MFDAYNTRHDATISIKKKPLSVEATPTVVPPFSTDNIIPPRQLPDTFVAPKKPKEDTSTLQLFRDARETEWIGNWALRAMSLDDYQIDPHFNFDNEEVRSELFDGLTNEQVDTFRKWFAEATSLEHARAIRRKTDEYLAIDKRLNEAGLEGLGMRVAAAILDPVAIAGVIASEGAAAPFIYANKIGRLQRAARAGLVAGGTNAGLEGILASMDPLRDLNNVAIAAAAGLVLGGTLGAVSGDRLSHQSVRAAHRLTEELGVLEGVRSNSGRLGDVGASSEVAMPKAIATVVDDDGELSQFFMEAPAVVSEQASGGSVGAALYPYVNDFVNTPTAQVFEEAERLRPVARDVTGQFDVYSSGIRSQHPMVAMGMDILAPSPVGVRTGGRPQPTTAWETSQRTYNTAMVRHQRSFQSAYGDWLKGQKANWFGHWTKREEFGDLVGRQVRDPKFSQDPHVIRAANEIRDVNRDLLRAAKDAGVKGFADVTENAQYLMRVHALTKWSETLHKFGDVQVDYLITQAIMRGSQELTEDQAGVLARTYRRNVQNAKWHVDFKTSTMFDSDQREWLKDAITKELKEAGENISDDVIEDMLTLVTKKTEGVPTRAKRRLGVDESTSAKVVDPSTGEQVDLAFSDLLENNAEVLMQSYLRSMSGLIGMARSGFKSPLDWEKYLANIRKTARNVKGYSPEQMETDIRTLDIVGKGVLGQPINDLHRMPTLRRVGRALRDYNFIRVMGQVGFAQLSEIGNITGQMGFRAALKHIPEMRKTLKRIKSGELDDAFARELEAIIAPGTDRLLQSPMSRYDDMNLPQMEKFHKVDRGLNIGTRLTADLSFMNPVNAFLERIAAKAAVQRFADMAHGGKKLSKKRLLSMGLDDTNAERVFEQMRKHTKAEPSALSGRKVVSINLNDWTDPIATDIFTTALQRWTRRAIQKNDLTDMPMFMTTEMGKVIFQFRSFIIAAWAKNLIHGVRMADMETFTSFMGTMVFGGMAYAAMHHIRAIGRDDREEYLETRLSPGALAGAAFYRSAWASLLPTVIDTGMMVAGQDQLFQYARTTGLASDIFGNPTLDLLDTASRAVRGGIAGVANPDYNFSQEDWNAFTRVLFLQNVTGIQNILHGMGASLDLPNRSQ